MQNIIKTVKDKCDPEVHLIHGLRIDPDLDNRIRVTVIATGFKDNNVKEEKVTVQEKTVDSDFIKTSEFEQMLDNINRPEHLSYLPHRDYQDDLDVPSVIRKYNFQKAEKPVHAIQLPVLEAMEKI